MSATQAADVNIRCDSCTTEVATSVRARQAGVGLHYIYNVASGLVWLYQVEREPVPGGTYEWYVYQESPELSIIQLVQGLKDIHQRTGGTMKLTVEVDLPTNVGIESAFDVSRPGGQRTRLMNWATTATPTLHNLPSQVVVALHSLVSAVADIWRSVSANTFIVVNMPDGSSVTLKYDALEVEYTFVEGRELDGAGNPIPDTPQQALEINFDFSRDRSGNSIDRQLRNAGMMGIEIRLINGTGNILTCIMGASGRISCVRS
ncbi:MAG: hypothetical protein AB7F83_12255 [Lysobacterales bacterium]